jgi:hypothetical protein
MSSTSRLKPLDHREPGLTIDHLADQTGLPADVWAAQGFSDIHVNGARVKVVYRDADGQEVGARFLAGLGPNPYHQWRKGSKPMPYGLDRLQHARDLGRITIVASEIDAIVLHLDGDAALALPSLDSWDDARDAPLLDGIDEITLVVSDQTRDAWLQRFSASPLCERLQVIDLGAESLLERRAANPTGWSHAWETLCATARQVHDDALAERLLRREAAFERAKAVLGDPDLLGRVAAKLRRLGYAGDVRPALLAVIVCVSRRLPRPLALVIVAPSGVGKSFAVDVACLLMPPGVVHKMSASTPLALVYSDVSLQHRVLYYAEADSMPEDGPAASALRSVLSDVEMAYEVTELNPATGRMGTRRIVKPGPTAFVTTFTRPLPPQFSTRVLQITLDVTPDQTRAILQAHAARVMPRASTAPDLTPFHALQDYLDLSDVTDVVVPFGTALAGLMPATPLRLRRDFPQLLGAVQAIALLYQCQRARDASGAVIATPADYAAARDLLAPHFTRTSAEGLTAVVRATIEAVQPGEEVSLTELQTRLGLKSSSSVHARVKKAVAGGWLLQRGAGRGHHARVSRGAALPGDDSSLPTLAQLLDVFEDSIEKVED